MAANASEVAPTKPRLRLRDRDGPRSEFDELIAQAIAVTRRVRAKSTPDSFRLTARALERDLLEASGADSDTKRRIDKLERDIQNNRAGLEHVRHSFREILSWLRSRRWTQVQRDLRRWDFLTTESARAQLARRGLGTTDLVIIAARHLNKIDKSIFGNCEDSAAHAAELAELKAQQAELFEKANKTWNREDVVAGEVDKRTGLAPVWFKRSGRQVLINPPENASKRLVDHILAHEK